MCKVSNTTPYGCAVPRLRSCLSDGSIRKSHPNDEDDNDEVPLRQTRSVSFDETVRVRVIAPLDAFAKRDVFYQAVDYRRFRSEAILETLDAQAAHVRQWKSVAMGKFVQTLAPATKSLDNYQPQEYSQYPPAAGLLKTWQFPSPTHASAQASKAAKIAMATSPASATLVIQQLAFTAI